MNIVFNFNNCGMGNNGGTRTILYCQKTLEKMGHNCDIITPIDKFTWFKHKPPLCNPPSNIDILIATSCKTVDSTLKIPAKKKAWYIRAHETWAMSEKELIKKYNSGLVNIVNSNALKEQLEQYGIKSTVVYQGIDIEQWYNTNPSKSSKITIGCLHTTQPRKRWKDFIKLANILGHKNYNYVGIGSSQPREQFLSNFVLNGDSNQLRELYSSCDIWFAPTNSEGLHNVPMEASLCGCLIVCSDAPLNGMIKDYANEKTAMIYPSKDINEAARLIQNAQWDLIKPMQNYIKTNIKSRRDNMQALVSLFE